LTFVSVLRSAGEHFDQIVVQAVEELALEGPLKLRVVEVARMKFEIVGMNRNPRILEVDDYFDGVTFGAGAEVEQRVLVQS
jgi:hypothetical protein